MRAERPVSDPARDERFMREALALAREAAAEGEVPVGAVVVRGDEIVGRGRNRRETGKTALAHAELEAIGEACRTLGGWRLWQCELFVTLEPCPMCAGAAINARLPRVVFGASDPKAGSCGSVTDLFALPYNHHPETAGGVLNARPCCRIFSARCAKNAPPNNKVFGQAFFKKLAGCGVEPRNAAQRQENGQQRGGGGPESAAGARTQAERARDTVKFLVKLFSKSLPGCGVEPRNAAQRQENGQQRGAGGPESAAGVRTQAERTPGTVKFLVKLFSKSLRSAGQSPANAAKYRNRKPGPLPPVRRTAWQRIFLYSL